MSPVSVYDAVCAAPDTATAVQELTLPEWQLLWSFLIQNYDENGKSGVVFGIAALNGAMRLSHQVKGGGL